MEKLKVGLVGVSIPPYFAEELDQIGQRGRRLDEAIPGTGLGLAIVKDILELYVGEMTLSRAKLGGLAVTISVSVPGG